MKVIRALGFSLALVLSAPAVAWAQTPEAGDTAAAPAPVADARRQRSNLRVFDRVWSVVERTYYDPTLNGVDWAAAQTTYRPQAQAAVDDASLYRTLNAMLDQLDDAHASAASPAQVRREQTQRGPRPLMGMTLYPDGERWRIESLREGSPAEAADVPLDWYLETVGGERWSPELELTEGVPVELTLADEAGTERRMTITPRLMPAPEVWTARWASPTVMVLDVDRFSEGLGRWMGAMLEGLPPGADVVLDLRANPGGLLEEAQNVLSCFLPEDTPWATRTSRAGRETAMRIRTRCGDLDGPVASDLLVLVDGGSRSSAELTPAVLRENGRAVVMGEQTPGSVLISQDVRLPDGGELSLSRADFVTEGGVRLEKIGVTPDVVAERTIEDRRARRDPVIDAAVARLSE